MDISKNYIKESGKLFIVLFLVLTAGIVSGSIYLMKSDANTDAALKSYLTSYISQLQSGIDKSEAMKKSILRNSYYLLAVFFGGFFRGGVLLTGYAVIRKGFFIGFTAAACIKIFGTPGMLVTASLLPGILIMLPTFLGFSSISTDFALNSQMRQKKFIIFYIFFAIIMLTIFCISAVCDGYLTTIFMKKATYKLIQQ